MAKAFSSDIIKQADAPSVYKVYNTNSIKSRYTRKTFYKIVKLHIEQLIFDLCVVSSCFHPYICFFFLVWNTLHIRINYIKPFEINFFSGTHRSFYEVAL